MSADKDARIAELERKLAEQQAVYSAVLKQKNTALEKLAKLGNGEHFGNSVGNDIAKEAFFIATSIHSEELNNLLAKAKEEGRKEAVPEGSSVISMLTLQATVEAAHMAGQYDNGAGCDPSYYNALSWYEHTGKSMLASAPKPQGETK